jgi:hypothetical protein
MSLLREVTAAAQESPQANPFGDMFLDVPADEFGFTLFRYVVPNREQALSQKRHGNQT